MRRERDPRDRRVVRLTLSPKGRRASAEVPVEPIGIYRRALALLTAEEAKMLHGIVDKLTIAVRRIVDEELGATLRVSPARRGARLAVHSKEAS